jgi:hypothetical protein
VTRPAQRLTVVVCTGCGVTTRNWSRLCNACTKRLAAGVPASMPAPQARCARHQVGANNLVGAAPVFREVIYSTEETK